MHAPRSKYLAAILPAFFALAAACSHDATPPKTGPDGRVVADARLPHAPGEHLGVGQRVPARLRTRRAREVFVEVDVHGAGQMAGLELGRAGPAVQVPADVGEHHVLREPSGVDEGRDHRPEGNRVTPSRGASAGRGGRAGRRRGRRGR